MRIYAHALFSQSIWDKKNRYSFDPIMLINSFPFDIENIEIYKLP
jgi:hypothetical protein